MDMMWEHLIWGGYIPESLLPEQTKKNKQTLEELKSQASPCEKWEDVYVSHHPWPSGIKTLHHIQVIKSEFVLNSISDDFYLVETEIRKKAFSVGANAIVGVERDLYLYDSPMWARVVGSAILAAAL